MEAVGSVPLSAVGIVPLAPPLPSAMITPSFSPSPPPFHLNAPSPQPPALQPQMKYESLSPLPALDIATSPEMMLHSAPHYPPASLSHYPEGSLSPAPPVLHSAVSPSITHYTAGMSPLMDIVTGTSPFTTLSSPSTSLPSVAFSLPPTTSHTSMDVGQGLTFDPGHSAMTSDLLDLQEMLTGDLTAMDWTSDQGTGLEGLGSGLNLTEAGLGSEGGGDSGMGSSLENTLNVATSKTSVNGAEPDPVTLGLTDKIDVEPQPSSSQHSGPNVSDWLDVIMPSAHSHAPLTPTTPLTFPADPTTFNSDPVTFTSDPVLTPKTQQEVLDLFNFDDATDFTGPDMNTVLAWDKLTS